jgi:hypothetical protein
VRSVYLVWLALTGATVLLIRIFGNPFGGNVEYRIEYTGKVGTTLWANYTIAEHNGLRNSTSEKVIGELPQTVKFTSKKDSIVSASGSTTDRDPVTIQIYKNGSLCASFQSDRGGITDTVICR